MIEPVPGKLVESFAALNDAIRQHFVRYPLGRRLLGELVVRCDVCKCRLPEHVALARDIDRALDACAWFHEQGRPILCPACIANHERVVDEHCFLVMCCNQCGKQEALEPRGYALECDGLLRRIDVYRRYAPRWHTDLRGQKPLVHCRGCFPRAAHDQLSQVRDAMLWMWPLTKTTLRQLTPSMWMVHLGMVDMEVAEAMAWYLFEPGTVVNKWDYDDMELLVEVSDSNLQRARELVQSQGLVWPKVSP